MSWWKINKCSDTVSKRLSLACTLQYTNIKNSKEIVKNTKENLSDIPEARRVCPDKGGIGLCDISFDEVSVLKSLEKLRDDKAAGADELVPRFLNF